MDLAGDIAVWCEASAPMDDLRRSMQHPWMVLHGGPGGRLGAAHVAPLRQVGAAWFGFDQRNSGLSEDLDLSVIDLQRFIDDALAVADALGIETFNVLGGSWGGTLAMALGAYRPERVVGMVLRAPFIPWRIRVDAFFVELQQLAPDYFNQHFGVNARSKTICELMLNGPPDVQLTTAVAWNRLENALLGQGGLIDSKPPFLTDLQELALVRKYRLQAHFLLHECFLPPADWACMLELCNQQVWPLQIVQGTADKVCPPGGAAFIAEMMPRATLSTLPAVGHLPDSQEMIKAVTHAVTQVVEPLQITP